MQSARQDLQTLAAHVLKNTDPAEAVVLAWPLVCGAAVAERVRAVAFENETLRVAVPDKGWQSQLEDFTPQYLHRLSNLSGVSVKRILYELVSASERRV
jgi:Dna[CI] antecedent DciA-like protein